MIDEKTGCEYMKCTDFKKGVCYYKYPYCKYRPEDDLFPSFEGILVEEECNNCGGDGSFYNQGMLHARVKCDRCKGTGKIRRPAEWEDLKIVTHIRGKHDICGERTVDLSLVLKSNGKLIVRDEKLNKDQARNNPI